MLDLLVIGAGLSGLMAAYTAVQAGLQVRVVNRGLGAMHWGAGTVDVLGYFPGAEEVVQRPFEAVSGLMQQFPEHPYTLLGMEQIASALRTFTALTEELGLPYAGAEDNEKNLLLHSPAGIPRPTYLAPQAQLAGDLDRNEPMLIVGFEGMRDYYPLLIAENLTKSGYQARAEILPMELLTNRHDSNPVQLAHELDDGARRTQLGKQLKPLVRVSERIGLPAILGLDDHAEAVADIARLSGAPVFEIPTLPPSVPGVRLSRALQDGLRSKGVRVETAMEVIYAQATTSQNGIPGRIAWMESKTTTRPLKHHAANFLLATGGILGGGFNSDAHGRVWEVILDLPLTVPQERSKWFDSSFLSPSGHPVYTGGVRVNREFQPVGSDGALLYENLWAAGHMLSGADPILERSLEGIAIITGTAAGKAIATR